MNVKVRNKLYKTGEVAPHSGLFNFVRYTDGTTSPPPTAEERVIRLTKGEIFPQYAQQTKGHTGGQASH